MKQSWKMTTLITTAILAIALAACGSAPEPEPETDSESINATVEVIEFGDESEDGADVIELDIEGDDANESEEAVDAAETPRPTAEPLKTPERIETPIIREDNVIVIPESVSTEAIPEAIMLRVLSDLGARSPEGGFQITVAAQMTYSDGALGCPQPGVMYTQALVDGYQVVIIAEGVTYDYRINDQGSFILCDGSNGAPTAGGTPDA